MLLQIWACIQLCSQLKIGPLQKFILFIKDLRILFLKMKFTCSSLFQICLAIKLNYRTHFRPRIFRVTLIWAFSLDRRWTRSKEINFQVSVVQVQTPSLQRKQRVLLRQTVDRHSKVSGEGNDNVGKELISHPWNAGASTYMRLRSSSVSMRSFMGISFFIVCLKILMFPSPIRFLVLVFTIILTHCMSVEIWICELLVLSGNLMLYNANQVDFWIFVSKVHQRLQIV